MEVQNMFKKLLILCVLSSFLVYAQDRTPEETPVTLINDSDKNSDLNSNTNSNNKRRPSEITLHNAQNDNDEELLTAIENLFQDNWENVDSSRNSIVSLARIVNWMLNTNDFKKAQTDEELLKALKNLHRMIFYKAPEDTLLEMFENEIQQNRDRMLYVAQRLQKGFDFSPYAFRVKNDNGYLVADSINHLAAKAYSLAKLLEQAELYEESIYWYQKSIEWGEDSYVPLVQLYQEIGDQDNAYKWLMKGVVEDSTIAKCVLGHWYFNGEISPYISRNRTKAYELRDEFRKRHNSNLCGSNWNSQLSDFWATELN